MASPRRTSLLCPGCRRLVSADEPACPHCGLKRPGAPWRAALGVFGPASRQLVPGLIAINITLYLLSLLLTPAGIGLALHHRLGRQTDHVEGADQVDADRPRKAFQLVRPVATNHLLGRRHAGAIDQDIGGVMVANIFFV